jgi:D-3-phosphoglycerate dehydrogenase
MLAGLANTQESGRRHVRALLTTTSYQDTPGEHHDLLEKSGFDIVRARGPLTEAQMLELVQEQGPFDAFLNGDDQITAAVIDAALPSLKTICKYGIGLDSIDVHHATAQQIPVMYTPGVNHTTVAEHAIGLMIAACKHFWPHTRAVKNGEWTRITGNELMGKTVGVLGMGRIGKELLIRAEAFGMKLAGFDVYWDDAFAAQHNVQRFDTPEALIQEVDVVSLHMPMTDQTAGFINAERIATMRSDAVMINTARGGLVIEEDVAEACRTHKLKAYAADVLNKEPMEPGHPFQEVDNILITPHIASRTFESVERQAVRATLNMVNFLNGNDDYIQANKF